MNVIDSALRTRLVGLGNEIPDVCVIGPAPAMEIHRSDRARTH
jgi:hypothetical protein